MIAIKFLCGVLCILLGIALGLYLGVYLMFVGGIIQFIEAAKADPVNGDGIAWGIVRVAFAALVGWGSAFLCFFLSSEFFDAAAHDGDIKRRQRNARKPPRRTGLR